MLCKIFLYCTRETNTPRKLLFDMLKRNEFFINTIFCPVFIMCVYTSTMNVNIHGICICSFMFYFGLMITTSDYLSSVLRFNKAD